jgi:hypothetical protein
MHKPPFAEKIVDYYYELLELLTKQLKIFKNDFSYYWMLLKVTRKLWCFSQPIYI